MDGLKDSPNCPACVEISKDVDHMIFHYPGFPMKRRSQNHVLERSLNPEGIVKDVERLKENWLTIENTERAIERRKDGEGEFPSRSNIWLLPGRG